MQPRSLATVAVLEDPVRGALYAFVRAAEEPVSRAAAAAGVGISAKLAAFHLDKLVDAGLLRAGVGSTEQRRVGRAPKMYEPTDEQVSVSIPPREPQLLAEILADGVTAVDGGVAGPAHEAVLRVARARGHTMGADERERVRPGRLGAERALALTAAVLSRHGFEPRSEPAAVRLRNCPFHPVAGMSPELVCGLNQAFVSGIVEGLAAEGCVEAVLRPDPGHCCVELRRA